LIFAVRSNSKGSKLMQKPDKILIHNTNLMLALGLTDADVGTQRETFFFNQLSNDHQIAYSTVGDYQVNQKYIFEIGGKSKTRKQVTGVQDAWTATAETEIGFEKKVPLWLFGFLY
jgi:uncharacterized protein